jgi:CHAT domain-containing protein
MRPADEHLTPQELELLLLTPADSRDSNAAGVLEPAAQHHLETCAVCQAEAERYRKVEEALSVMSINASPDVRKVLPGPDCAPEESWLQIATGLMNDEDAARLLAHAAMCRRCGTLLKEAMQDLSEQTIAEEEEALSRLPMSSPEWQRAMAIRLAEQSGGSEVQEPEPAKAAGRQDVSTQASEQKLPPRSGDGIWRGSTPPAPSRPSFRWWPQTARAAAAMAVAVIAIASWFIVLKTRKPDANQSYTETRAQLVQAYVNGDQRVMELRIPGMPWGAAPSGERGTGGQNLSPQLYLALGTIQTELSKHPQDPYWLQASARANLMAGNYEAAKNNLEDALQRKPGDTGLLLDKATALFVQAKKTGDESFYGKAADGLGDVIRQDPGNSVALFNRAIIYEKMNARDDAIDDLKRFLQLEPDSPWAGEAKSRLNELQKQEEKYDRSRAEPLLPPEEFARKTSDPEVLPQIDSRIEDYQEEAIVKWLPRAFPFDQPGDQAAMAALHALARVLAARHRDAWLSDFLESASGSPAFPAATLALQNAVEQTAQGRWETGQGNAQEASELFAQSGSNPGRLRAAAEEVHALRGKQDGKTCLQKADQLNARLKNLNYPWISAQVHIDQCSCAGMVGNFDRAEKSIQTAERKTLESGYPTLHLRALGIAASADTLAGRMAAAWSKNEQGLQEYWAGSSPPIRVQQFYDDLSVLAEELEQWNLATAFEQESAHAISLTADRKTEAMVRRHLAKLAIYTDNLGLVQEEIRLSDQLESNFPSEQSLAGKTYSEIDRAQIDLRQGKLAEAERRLGAIQTNVNEISNFEIVVDYYSTRASLLRQEGRTEEARKDFETALKKIDSNAKNLSSVADRYLWNLEISHLYRSLIELEMKQDRGRDALEAWEWYRATPLRRLSRELDVFDPFTVEKKVKELVRKEDTRTVLSYSILPDGVAIWVMHNGEVEPVFQPGRTEDLLRRARHLTVLCMDRNSDLPLLQQEAGQLYARLVAPIAARIASTKNLVIESDEVLGNLPFEVLLSPEGRYLGESRSITYSPGLLYGTYLRDAGSLSARSRVVAVGSTATLKNAEPPLEPIPEVRGEAQAIADQFLDGVPLKGKDASVSRLETFLPKAEIVHLAAHGIVTSQNEGLLLYAGKDTAASTDDTVLWSASHVRLELFQRAKLVVLAACSSGQNMQSRTETRGGLVRALLAARVPNVVASRWNVNSKFTSDLMAEFYLQLTRGSTVSSAMAAAAMQMRGKLHKAHPYYWAAFAVVGRG